MTKIITILVDNDSWILPYAEELVQYFSATHQSSLVRKENDIPVGDICFLLGCTQIVSEEALARNSYNFVVHESELPQGKGFAPMAWQIIAGQNKIPVCLIEASNKVDSGDIWLQDIIELNGNELHDEWRNKQVKVTIDLAKNLVLNIKNLTPKPQQGQESIYSRRTPKDSELCLDKTLAEQFDLLRTVCNKDHPAFFIKDGIKYTLEITKDE